jgi:hypothetical protein
MANKLARLRLPGHAALIIGPIGPIGPIFMSQGRGDLSAIALAKAEARGPTAPLLRLKRRGNPKVVTGAPPNEISVQLQPCEVPHSVQTPHAPVRMTLVLPQCEQLIPMYIFSSAARTRSACN